MVSVPSNNPFTDPQDTPVTPLVYFDGSYTEEYRPTKITRTLGSAGMSAVLVRNLKEDENRLKNLQLIKDSDAKVDVWFPDEEGEREFCAFSGKIIQAEIIIEDGEEQLMLTCRDSRTLFGDPVLGAYYWDATASDYQLIDDDPVFNPRIDGEIDPNMVVKKQEDGQLGFIDPESVRTQAAQDYNDAVGLDWTLLDAFDYFTWTLNSDESWVENPAIRTVSFNEPVPLKDVRIRRGLYLPEILDQLLNPHGFEWFVKITNSGGTPKRSINVIKRGSGRVKPIRLQGPGETYDRVKSSLTKLSLAYNIENLASKVVAHGAKKRREATIELYPAWPEAQDSLTAEDLKKSDPDSSYREYPHAWRLWVGNEAGDWGAYRDHQGVTISDVLSLSDLFGGDYLPRRRVFEQPITARREGGEDGDAVADIEDHRPRPWPIYVEYYNMNERAWKEVSSGYIVRNDQLAIEFTGDEPPAEIMDSYGEGEFPRLRVTATLTSDERLSFEKEFTGGTPTNEESILFLDLSDRFVEDLVHVSGDQASVLAAMTPEQPNYERDDFDDMEEFVEKVVDLESAAVVQGSATLFELRTDYELGDLVNEVAGRNISLNRLTGDNRQKKYPQISSITWDVIRQTTTFSLDSLDA